MALSASEVVLDSLRIGDAGWLIQRHAELYSTEAGFDATFEPLVARILADFLDHHDPARERGWIARAGGHHVDMALQDQRPALGRFGPKRADDRPRAGKVVHDGAEPAERLQVLRVDRPFVHGEAALPHRRRHEVLRRRLLAPRGGDGDEIGQKARLRLEPCGHRRADRRLRRLIKHHHASDFGAALRRFAPCPDKC
jgi:hypothetical protein